MMIIIFRLFLIMSLAVSWRSWDNNWLWLFLLSECNFFCCFLLMFFSSASDNITAIVPFDSTGIYYYFFFLSAIVQSNRFLLPSTWICHHFSLFLCELDYFLMNWIKMRKFTLLIYWLIDLVCCCCFGNSLEFDWSFLPPYKQRPRKINNCQAVCLSSGKPLLLPLHAPENVHEIKQRK